MSKKASNFQKVVMSIGYRGKEIFKPLNTGWIDDNVACVREWIYCQETAGSRPHFRLKSSFLRYCISCMQKSSIILTAQWFILSA